MKPYIWSEEKDAVLRKARGFGFADIVAAVEAGQLLDEVPHPGPGFEHQRMLIVTLRGCVVVVPSVADGDVRFLETAYYNRRAQTLYLGGSGNG